MPVFIPIIAGTTRQESKTQHVARFVEEVISKETNVSTQLVDINTLDLSDGEDGDLEEKNKSFIETIEKADGYIIVAPEYNHSLPGSLKSALDICFEEYNNKAVGFVGVSSGTVGGARMIEQLVGVSKALGLKCVKKDVLVGPVNEKFSEDGELLDEGLREKVVRLSNDVAKLAEALKPLRENK